MELRFAPRGVTVVRVTTSLSRAIIPGIRILVKGPTSGTVRNRPVTMRYRLLSIVVQSPLPQIFFQFRIFHPSIFAIERSIFFSLFLCFFFSTENSNLRHWYSINYTCNDRFLRKLNLCPSKFQFIVRVNCHYLLLFVISDTLLHDA